MEENKPSLLDDLVPLWESDEEKKVVISHHDIEVPKLYNNFVKNNMKDESDMSHALSNLFNLKSNTLKLVVDCLDIDSNLYNVENMDIIKSYNYVRGYMRELKDAKFKFSRINATLLGRIMAFDDYYVSFKTRGEEADFNQEAYLNKDGFCDFISVFAWFAKTAFIEQVISMLEQRVVYKKKKKMVKKIEKYEKKLKKLSEKEIQAMNSKMSGEQDYIEKLRKQASEINCDLEEAENIFKVQPLGVESKWKYFLLGSVYENSLRKILVMYTVYSGYVYYTSGVMYSTLFEKIEKYVTPNDLKDIISDQKIYIPNVSTLSLSSYSWQQINAAIKLRYDLFYVFSKYSLVDSGEFFHDRKAKSGNAVYQEMKPINYPGKYIGAKKGVYYYYYVDLKKVSKRGIKK